MNVSYHVKDLSINSFFNELFFFFKERVLEFVKCSFNIYGSPRIYYYVIVRMASIICYYVIAHHPCISAISSLCPFHVLCHPIGEASLNQQLLWTPLDRVHGHAQSLDVRAEVSFPDMRNC